MPWLGAPPADVALSTDDLEDGIVTTAKIAANNVDGTLTKDALIADYSDVTITAADLLMYGDATDSNNTKRDTVQGILDLAGGGWQVITRTAVTSPVSEVEFTTGLGADNTVYRIVYEQLLANVDAAAYDLMAQVGVGATFRESGYYSEIFQFYYSTSTNVAAATDGFLINDATDNVAGASGIIDFFNMNNASVKTTCIGRCSWQNYSGPAGDRTSVHGGRYDTAEANTSLRLDFQNAGDLQGNVDSFVTLMSLDLSA